MCTVGVPEKPKTKERESERISKFHRFVAAFFSRALRTFSGPYSACRGFLDRPLEFCGSFWGSVFLPCGSEATAVFFEFVPCKIAKANLAFEWKN